MRPFSFCFQVVDFIQYAVSKKPPETVSHMFQTVAKIELSIPSRKTKPFANLNGWQKQESPEV